MNEESKIKKFICDNREHLVSVIQFLLNALQIKLPFYKLIVNNVIIPALEEYLRNICIDKN
jgi:hypothetical protein